MYGNYCFWSWFRYWYVDSCNKVMLILLDKGYFDYDYEKTEAPLREEDVIKSDEEIADMLSKFGVAVGKKPETLDEIQDYVIENIKED